MFDREAMYLKLPIPLQHLMCSMQGASIQRRRFGAEFRELLRDAEIRALWTREKVEAYRDQRLREFVRHCARTVPFYRRRFQECGISPDRILSIEDLGRLPVLTKAEVQDHQSELMSDAVPRYEAEVAHTSGTTGGGLRFATTIRAVQEQWATWWRYRRWHGLEPGTWCGYFGGRSVVPLAQTGPPFWRCNYPGKQILFSAYHMSPGNLGAYVDELRRRQPPWLHGYPSLLSALAAYVLESGADLGYELRWITIGAENLMPHQAELIERALGVRPRQHYGMAEATANVSECERGSLHVDEDFAAVEFLPNPDGPGYRVVGTNFTNPATPLLRYEVQDIASLSTGYCDCGRPGRILASVDGREEDYIVLPNGARLGRMDHVFKDLINIREAQLYQNCPSELVIRIVRGGGYAQKDETLLLKEVRRRVGTNMAIRLEYRDTLTRSRSGKLRFVVSEMAEGQTRRAA